MKSSPNALKSLSKNDCENVARANKIRRKDGATDHDVVRRHLASIKTLATTQTVSNRDLTGAFHYLQMYFRDTAIIDRLHHNDPSMLAAGLSTSARFGYLKAVTGGTDHSGGYDCLHVFDLLAAVACRDHTAEQSFLTRFSPPFKYGHQSTVLLCNGVYAALGADPTPLLSIAPKLRSRKESKFFRAMYDCLVAIADSSPTAASEAIVEMLRGNRRQDFHSPMEKIICVEGHAFYRICARSSPGLLRHFDAHTSFPWDAAYQDFLHSSSNQCGQPIDFTMINKVLGAWVTNLPQTVDVNELVSSL